MSNEIIKSIGQVVGRTLLDGARLGTASVVGDIMSRKIKKLFRSKDENSKEEEREPRAKSLLDQLTNKES